MSRSYKKTWGWTDTYNGKKLIKRFANKKVRKMMDIPNGGAYKKCFESRGITTYKFLFFNKKRTNKQQFLEFGIPQYKYYMK